MSSKLYPVNIDYESSDWYRNYSVKGSNNSHLAAGFEMRWSLEVYSEIRSFDTGVMVRIFNLVIL